MTTQSQPGESQPQPGDMQAGDTQPEASESKEQGPGRDEPLAARSHRPVGWLAASAL